MSDTAGVGSVEWKSKHAVKARPANRRGTNLRGPLPATRSDESVERRFRADRIVRAIDRARCGRIGLNQPVTLL